MWFGIHLHRCFKTHSFFQAEKTVFIMEALWSYINWGKGTLYSQSVIIPFLPFSVHVVVQSEIDQIRNELL